MKKIIYFLFITLALQTQAQTFTIIKDEVLVGKKIAFKFASFGSKEINAFVIKNFNDEDLVTIQKITEKSATGAIQYLVSFSDGNMGVCNASMIEKNMLTSNILKTKAIQFGNLDTIGVPLFCKKYLRPFLTATEAIDTKAEIENSEKDTPSPIVAKEEVKPINKPVMAEAKPIGNIEDRDISADIIIKGKTIVQDGFVIGTFMEKTETIKGQKITKLQFKNYKGRFVSEVAFIKDATEAKLYNAITKERTDIEVLQETDINKIIEDLVGQLIDLEILL